MSASEATSSHACSRLLWRILIKSSELATDGDVAAQRFPFDFDWPPPLNIAVERFKEAKGAKGREASFAILMAS